MMNWLLCASKTAWGITDVEYKIVAQAQVSGNFERRALYAALIEHGRGIWH